MAVRPSPIGSNDAPVRQTKMFWLIGCDSSSVRAATKVPPGLDCAGRMPLLWSYRMPRLSVSLLASVHESCTKNPRTFSLFLGFAGVLYSRTAVGRPLL